MVISGSAHLMPTLQALYFQVILSVMTSSHLQTVVNMFLINLAMADILVLTFCAPFSILQVNFLFVLFLYLQQEASISSLEQDRGTFKYYIYGQ